MKAKTIAIVISVLVLLISSVAACVEPKSHRMAPEKGEDTVTAPNHDSPDNARIHRMTQENDESQESETSSETSQTISTTTTTSTSSKYNFKPGNVGEIRIISFGKTPVVKEEVVEVTQEEAKVVVEEVEEEKTQDFGERESSKAQLIAALLLLVAVPVSALKK